ncbi:hypothetical protein HPT27_01890 [Permianibacter sp. IMCC34836]|uniref:hypothetical protein n=1 Tax=Permianibacter fluminis TaxID=2738515 RepID=UPI001556F55A|nr:hypothetical protein [Permianibacter fluminis]NQD35753.1 hypothetical protein [Permianibacter fluminis]
MMLELYSALTLACLLLLPLPLRRLRRPYRLLIALLLLALTQLPIEGVALAGHWRATIGEPAITTALLLLMMAWHKLHGHRPTMPTGLRHYLPIIGVLALVFYPLTMGASPLDPYRLGYQPHGLLMLTLLAALWCWYQREFVPALLLAAATTAFAFDLLSSTNYWDYLLDPMLGVFGLLVWLRQGLRKWRRYRHRRQTANA